MRDAFPRICGGETRRGRGYGDGASRFFRPNRSGGVVRGSSGSFGIRDSSWRGTLDSIKNVVAQSHIPPAFTILPQTYSSRGAKKDLPGISRKAGSETMYSRMYGNFPFCIERQGTLFRQSIRRRATGGNAFWHSRNSSVRPRPRRRRRTAPTPPRGGTSVCSGPFSHLQISRPGKMRKARVPSPSLSFHQGFISSRSLLLRA